MCVYVYVYVTVCVCVYVYVCMCMCMCMWMKVYVYAHMYVFKTFHNGWMLCATSLTYIYIYIYLSYHESSRTPQHSKWNCVGTNRPQHKHTYGHIVCD